MPSPQPPDPTDEELLELLRGFLRADVDAWYRVAHEVPTEEPELCWRLIEVARRADLSDKQLALVSAGPFEDLMNAHGEQFIERVESEARRDPKMRFLLGTVWKGKMSAPVWDRIQRLRGTLGIRQV
jgi:hypothetical protein